jgi:hypothetical protein
MSTPKLSSKGIASPLPGRPPEDFKLGAGEAVYARGFRVKNLKGKITVTRHIFGATNSPEPATPERDGFYSSYAVFRIKAGARKASFTLEYRPRPRPHRWPVRLKKLRIRY